MILSSLLLLAAAPQADAGEPTRDPVGRVTVYRLDTVETLDGDAQKNVSILVRDGIIERMGQAVVIPDSAEVIDLRRSGQVTMPPLVLTHANWLIGDRRGNGSNGRFTAMDSMWLEDGWEEDMLEHGVLLVGVDPPGSGLPGRTSVLLADGQVGRPDALVEDLYLKVTMATSRAAKKLVRDGLKAADDAIEKEDKARQDWEKARKEWEEKKKAAEEEAKKKAEEAKKGEGGTAAQNPEGGKQEPEGEAPPETFEPPKMDPNVAPLVDWVRKERPAQLWLRSASDWLHWEDVVGERELSYDLVLRHGRSQNFAEVADALAATGLRVERPAQLWLRSASDWLHWEDVVGERELSYDLVLRHGRSQNFAEVADALAATGLRVEVPANISFLPFTRVRANLPAELAAAGVEKLVLAPSSDTARGLEDWRVGVSRVVAEGLDRMVALKAMSLEPAAALGQEELIAPLAAGAPATFVIWSGDPLDPMSEVDFVVSAGEVVYDRAKKEKEEAR